MSATDLLRAELTRAARSLGAPEAIEPVLERPRDPAFGDWATNIALVLAKPLKSKPRELAQAVVQAIDFRRAGIRSAEIAGPGFINFRVDVDVVADGITALVRSTRRMAAATTAASGRSTWSSCPRTRPDRSMSAMADRLR